MKIKVNDLEFDFPWEKSRTSSGWEEFNEWWERAIISSYDELVGYPMVRVETNLPQLVVIGVIYGAEMQFGSVKSNGVFEALWYCAPPKRQWQYFLNALRMAEHKYSAMEYNFGNPRWAEEVL
jgi:hypothetical protein